MGRGSLYVALPPWTNSHERWSSLLSRMSAEPRFVAGGGIIYRVRYDATRLGRREPMRRLALTIAAEINQEWVRAGGYDSVILMGHSLGAVLARQSYLFALGSEPTYAPPYPWAKRVTRIALFAGMNRGLDWERGAWWFRILAQLASFIPTTRSALLRDCLRGSAFITNLRVQWIRVFDDLADRQPIVVQLLGTQDPIVTSDDSLDLEQFASAYHVMVPGADHASLADIDAAEDASARWKLLASSLFDAQPQGRNRVVDGPSRVVFLTHGIRAFAFSWPLRAERMIKQRDSAAFVVRPSKGWFSALRFLIPLTRRNHLRMFRDAYAEALARNPRAEFLYIGHSNGTYLLGQNLRLVPGMKFHRAVVAASVLPADYRWDTVMDNDQVGALRTDHAAADIPVGVFCTALRTIGMEDVGPGGFVGFQKLGPKAESVAYHNGGHGAMMDSANLPALVDFILPAGVAPNPASSTMLRLEPHRGVVHLMHWAGVLTSVILLSALGAAVLFVSYAPVLTMSLRVLLVAAFVALIVLLLDRL